MSKDIRLNRWSNVLLVLVILCALITAVGPFYGLVFDGPIVLFSEHGQKIWSSTLLTLPVFERTVVMAFTFLSSAVWLYALFQLLRLARYYRHGQIFAANNAVCFIYIGLALGTIGILNSVTYPVLNVFLYWRGITPWLGDMPALFTIQPDYIMAGVFFFILGKIMKRGRELEESDRLIV